MIGKLVLVIFTLMGLASNVCAEQIVLNPQHPQNYVVVKGDTLWDIAGRFLRYPWQWPAIWSVNQQIANPNLIYPGDELTLTYKDGRPLLGLTRGRNLKLSPAVREHVHSEAIPPIPLDAIHQFLSRPRVVTEHDIDRAAYVIGSQDQHLVNGVGGRIYVRGLSDASRTAYSVFRTGAEYRDPDTNALLGYEALHVADAVMYKFGDPATVEITWSNREVRNGDRLLPQEADEYPEFVPHAPEAAVDGRIISVIDGVSQIGQHNVVVINKGHADGLAPGHVLAIFQAGKVVQDPLGTAKAAKQRVEDLRRAELENPSGIGRFFDHVANNVRDAKHSVDAALGESIGGAPMTVELPEERAGELLIFRTFDSVSYGLVMDTQRAVHVKDKVRNP